MLKSFIKLCWIFPLLAACSQGNWTIDLTSLQNTLEKARPGDTIYIKSGTYTNIQLQLEGYGTVEEPIVVMTQQPGSVFIEGVYELRLCGE